MEHGLRFRLLSLVVPFLLPDLANAQPTPDALTATAIRSRLAAIASEESDRSTPDRAVRSYFLHLNNRSEIGCLRQELAKRLAGVGDLPLSEFDRVSDSLRDAYFTGVAARSISRFRVERGFEECMRRREVYSYTISGVETLSADRVRYAVQATNTTPISADAPRDSISSDMRAAGTQYRYELVRIGREWRIAQIEERGHYSTSYIGDWRPLFRETDMLPSIPFMVPSYP